MKNLSLLFSGRGSNVNSILSHIIKKRLNFNVKIIVCDNKNAAGIKILENYNFNYAVLDTRSFANKIVSLEWSIILTLAFNFCSNLLSISCNESSGFNNVKIDENVDFKKLHDQRKVQ